MLGYMGQAAYLMENHADASQAFFSSVPGKVQLLPSISNIHASLANETTLISLQRLFLWCGLETCISN
jgi:K+ transporter